MMKLLVFLVVTKRQNFMGLVKAYAKSIPHLREMSKELPWELYLEELNQEYQQ